jgi:hypothetical protein
MTSFSSPLQKALLIHQDAVAGPALVEVEELAPKELRVFKDVKEFKELKVSKELLVQTVSMVRPLTALMTSLKVLLISTLQLLVLHMNIPKESPAILG